MPLTKTNTGNAIRGIVVPTRAQQADCRAVIKELGFADLGRGARTLYTVGTARLDMQGRTAAGAANIQVQIGTGSVAAVIIANSVMGTQDLAHQKGVTRGAISVLNTSMDTGNVWMLTGSLPGLNNFDLIPNNNRQVIGSIFTGPGKDGDFSWMLNQPEYNGALFIFNDNEAQFLAHRSQPDCGSGCAAGGGNAVIRPWQCKNPPRAAGIPTGNGVGYPKLTSEVKQYIDDAISTIRKVADENNYKRIIYSAANAAGDLGTSIYSPAEAVKSYIVTQLRTLQN